MNELTNKLPALGKVISFFGMASWAIIIIVNISLAVAVFKSASALERQRGHSQFGAPIIWALATLVGGVLTVLAYWFIHHSTLSPQSSPKPDSSNT